MEGFVGIKQVSCQHELRQLIETSDELSYYFLRWPHKVSGIINKLVDFPSPEGQMFNSKMELRWQQKGLKYEVLILSKIQLHPSLGFKGIGNSWQVIERDAHLHPATETRFPQKFTHQKVKVAQRYFIDKETATTHFVALTVAT